MYDIEALEQQWKRYKQRRVLRAGTAVMGILLAGGLFAYFLSHKPMIGTAVAQKKSTGKERNRSVVAAVAGNETQTSPVSQSRTPDTFKEPTTEKKIELKMTDLDNDQVIKEIERRFPETRDYDDAIFLAQFYYDKHQYAKAENWALQANNLDSTREESWILYGKAKAKLGYRSEALRVLQTYYDQSGSESVKILIDQIRRGKTFE